MPLVTASAIYKDIGNASPLTHVSRRRGKCIRKEKWKDLLFTSASRILLLLFFLLFYDGFLVLLQHIFFLSSYSFCFDLYLVKWRLLKFVHQNQFVLAVIKFENDFLHLVIILKLKMNADVINILFDQKNGHYLKSLFLKI